MKRIKRAYDIFNKRLFGGVLPPAEFPLNVRRKLVLEFVPPNRIEVGAHMAEASPVEVLDGLLHCMVHVANHVDSVVDHNQNQYHNANFMSKALSVGLYVGLQSTRGWAVAGSNVPENIQRFRMPESDDKDRREAAYKEVGLTEKHLTAFRSQIRSSLKQPKRLYQIKYICNCDPPFNSIRTGRRPDGNRPLDITCNHCNSKFKPSKG